MGIATPTAGLNVSRMLVALSVLVALALTIYSVAIQGAKFDVQAFGIGIGALLFGGGGMMYLTPPGADK